jgi:hypothetical protein
MKVFVPWMRRAPAFNMGLRILRGPLTGPDPVGLTTQVKGWRKGYLAPEDHGAGS